MKKQAELFTYLRWYRTVHMGAQAYLTCTLLASCSSFAAVAAGKATKHYISVPHTTYMYSLYNVGNSNIDERFLLIQQNTSETEFTLYP